MIILTIGILIGMVIMKMFIGSLIMFVDVYWFARKKNIPIYDPIWLVVSNIFYFPFHIWDVILPIVELNHIYIYMYIYIYILLHFINLPIDLADFPFH